MERREGSESFAEAWDLAAEMGRDHIRDCSIDRATDGAWVPVTRRGKIVRMEFRYFDRLAIAVLSGREAAVSDCAKDRAEARAIRRRQRAEERRSAAAERARPNLEAEERRWTAQPPPPPRGEPRIRRL